MDDVLMSAPLFAALDVEAAAALKASMDERRLLKGDILFAEGDPGDRLYVVTDGKIKLGHAAPDGREAFAADRAWGWDEAELPFFEYSERSVGQSRRYFDAQGRLRLCKQRPGPPSAPP